MHTKNVGLAVIFFTMTKYLKKAQIFFLTNKKKQMPEIIWFSAIVKSWSQVIRNTFGISWRENGTI